MFFIDLELRNIFILFTSKHHLMRLQYYWIVIGLVILMTTCGCASTGNDVIVGRYISLGRNENNWTIAVFNSDGTFYFGPSLNSGDATQALSTPLPVSGTWNRPDEAEIQMNWNDGRKQLIPYGPKNTGFADASGTWHDLAIVVQGITLKKVL